jgi:hypothetical protein
MKTIEIDELSFLKQGESFIFSNPDKVEYFQDMGWWRGFDKKDEIIFTVDKILEKENSINFWLVADGYGIIGKNYGNGKICVSIKKDCLKIIL